MSLLSFFSSRQAPQKLTDDQISCIIELMYRSNELAHLLLTRDEKNHMYNCICGSSTVEPSNPANHREVCPLGNYYKAMEEVAKEGL